MFHLEWDHFCENMISSIKNFKEKEFSDVILACEGRQVQEQMKRMGNSEILENRNHPTSQVMSHKLVLAASSPLFYEMLVKHPHPQPLLFLKGVEYLDLEALLSFIYTGKVEMEQGRLESFLQLGQELQVKGLTKEQVMPQKLTLVSDIREDADMKSESVNKKQEKVKAVTWFPDNFQVRRPLRSPDHRKGSVCQEMFAMQGPKMQMGHQSTSSTHAGSNSSMVTSKNLDPSEGNPCPTIRTQGTLQQVLKDLSESKHRAEPAITAPTKTENGNCCLDSDVGHTSSLNASSLSDEEEVRFPELSCSKDFFKGDNGTVKSKSKTILVPKQCYPGNFPDFVEQSKDADKSKTTFRCKLCKKIKLHRSGLVQHIESAHFPGTFVHTCKFCDKTVQTKSALNSHLHSCKNRFFQINNNNRC